MLVGSQMLKLQLALTTSATSSSYTSRLSTTTQPAGSATRCIVTVEPAVYKDDNTLVVFPFGGNDNNDQVAVKVMGWNQTPLGLWVNTTVCDILATLSSTLVGVAGTEVVATNFFADTLSITSGIAVTSPQTADVDHASFLCSVSGYQLVEIQCKVSTNGDVANALWRFE